MPIDPVAAALDALAAYFTTALPGCAVLRAWPEAEADLDLSKTTIVLTQAGPAKGTRCPPGLVDQTDAAPNVVCRYRVAWLEVPIQIDCWSPFRAERDDQAPDIDEKLNNGLPYRPGLWIDSTGYYSRPLIVDTSAISFHDSGEDVSSGIWRRTWDGTIRSDLVAHATLPKLAVLTLRAETDLSGITLSEDVDITP